MCKLLHYQAKVITISGKRSLLHYQAKLFHYQAASLLHYRVMLLHYQAVITLTGDYYIIGCNRPAALKPPWTTGCHLLARQKVLYSLAGCIE